MARRLRHDTGEYSFVAQPSRIQGIGVFAIHAIEANVWLRLFRENERVRWQRPTDVPPEFHRYCVRFGEWFACPRDFGAMSIGWYLNHSAMPNAYHHNYRYFSKQRIKKGEEITVDYDTLGY